MIVTAPPRSALLLSALLLGGGCGDRAWPAAADIDSGFEDPARPAPAPTEQAPSELPTPSVSPAARPTAGDGAAPVQLQRCAQWSVAPTPRTAPVDVIWVVDSSRSMRSEAALIQDNLAAFTEHMERAGLDYRVVMLTGQTQGQPFIQVPALWSNDRERFRFVPREVPSGKLLGHLMDQLESFEDFLRPRARTHFVLVSDDEDELGGEHFTEALRSRLGRDFRVHAIASEQTTHEVCRFGALCEAVAGCSGVHGTAANVGSQYFEAATRTGGMTFSICTEDWQPLFDALAQGIGLPETLPCQFGLSEPATRQPDRTNLLYASEDQPRPSLWPQVADARACEGLGWFVDAEVPGHITLCDGSCALLDAPQAQLDVLLGCETVLR